MGVNIRREEGKRRKEEEKEREHTHKKKINKTYQKNIRKAHEHFADVALAWLIREHIWPRHTQK